MLVHPVLEVENLSCPLGKETGHESIAHSGLIRRKGGKQRWLGPLSFSIWPGECVALMGRSGVGKTTLLQVLAGFRRVQVRPGAGHCTIRINGVVVEDSARDIHLPPWRRNIGFAFQNGAGLQGDRSVRQNLEFPLRYGGTSLSGGEIESLVEESVERFWLKHAEDTISQVDTRSFVEQLVRTLSGGQRQRAALARCFIRRGRSLYLLDEPLQGQDNPLRQQLVEELRTIILAARGEARALVLITHNQAEALSLAHKIIFLHTDPDRTVRLLCESRPEDIYYRPPHLTVGTFLGDPYMNVWEAEVSGNDLLLGGLPIGRTELVPHGFSSVRVGVRPEEMRLLGPGDELPQGATFVEARIKRITFEGEEWVVLLKLEVPQGEHYARIQVQRLPEWVKEESSVTLGWHNTATHLFDPITLTRLS